MCVAFCFWHKAGQSDVVIWISAIPIAVGDVVAYSCLIALYSNAVLPEAQGKVMGMCFIVVAVIWALTGVAGGVLMGIAKLFPLMLAPCGVILALLLLHSGFGKNTFR
jgi:DHA1 family tetracycline resistance protein-like MFS transporter